MIEGLVALLDLSAESAGAAFLVFLRVGAVMTLVPAFGEQSVPVRAKLVLSLALTAIVAPSASPGITAALDSGRPFALLGVLEVVVGLAVGMALRLMVNALQMAGTIAANMTSLSQVLGGAGVDPQPAIAHILLLAGLALAAALGLHVKIAVALIGTYDVLPAGEVPFSGDLAAWGTSQVAGAFRLAFVLAAPFTVAALVYNLALGAINRAMPQLMVAFVGAPAITWGALVLLFLSAPSIISVWSGALDALLAQPLGGG
jgi:flagellar biosynthesis protein FliR